MDGPKAPSKAAPKPPGSQWSSRSDIALFIHALHLLNLDLLPDFPGSLLSLSAFKPGPSASKLVAGRNPQHRVKTIEWSLYRLFEVYDRHQTHVRLSPNFPPTTPLHSLNLRAALHKWLTELKRDGALPRDMVLRKTTLDECKGEKFEELLAHVAMLALKTSIAAEESKNARQSTLTRNPQVTGRSDPNILIPLIIAHRIALGRDLEKRQVLRDQAEQYNQALENQLAEASRLQQTLTGAEADEVDDPPADEQEALRDRLFRACASASSRPWAQYILEGDPDPAQAAALTDPVSWPFVDAGDSTTAAAEASKASPQSEINAPMMALQLKVERQGARLRELQSRRDSLLADAVARTPQDLTARHVPAPGSSSAGTAKSVPRRRFDRHETLTLDNL